MHAMSVCTCTVHVISIFNRVLLFHVGQFTTTYEVKNELSSTTDNCEEFIHQEIFNEGSVGTTYGGLNRIGMFSLCYLCM